jgi:uncharacterized membrane protein
MPARTGKREPMTDQRVDEIIGGLLRYGVMLSASVVAAGGIWYLIQYGATLPGYRVFRGEPENLRHLRGIVTGIPGFHCRRMIQLGLVLLIATPVARVAFSVVAFTLQRDRAYVVITVIVLAVLAFSLIGRASG